MSPSASDRVGIFIGGVQKGGTTSLFAHFCEHPQLAAGDTKELHYFDNEALDWTAPGYDLLHQRFAPGNGARRRFDATPIYLFWPPALQRIQRYNPQARFVLLFREPIARAYSAWSMEYRRGVERLSFGEAIRTGRQRLPLDQPTAPEWRVHSYIERGFYGRQVAAALSLFPREQLLFVRSSDLYDDHATTLAAIASFLGVQPFPEGGPKREHQRPRSCTLEPVQPEDQRHLAALYSRDSAHFAALTGLRVDDWPSMRHP